MKNCKFAFSSVVLTALIILASCGGGGGSSSPPQPTATHLYYFNRTTGGLFFHDPVTKATTTVEASGITGGESEFIGGTYSAAASQLNDVHFNSMVYAKGGKLYKVSLLKSATHTPVQVSNETEASIICDNTEIPDLANLDNSVYAYELPGPDGFCYEPDDTGDNVWKAVRLSSSPYTTPMEITSLGMEPVTDIRNWSTAALVGQLAVNHFTDALVKCTTDFTSPNCTTLLSSPTSTVKDAGSLGVDISRKKVYLWVFDGTEYQVKTYDTISDVISAPVYTTLNPIAEGLQDSNAIYFGSVHTLYKLTLGTTPAIVSLLTETIVTNAMLTDNRIVYVSKEDLSTGATTTTYTLKSALKSDGTTTVLATASDPASLQLVVSTGNAVFYNVDSGLTDTAGYVKDDGMGKHEAPSGRWTASSYSSTMAVSSGIVAPEKMIMSKSSGELRSFDATTYSSSSTGILLGTMPTADGMDTFHGGGIGSNILGYDVNPSNGDIFTVNVNTVDSLYRVTDTPSEDESPYLW